jgi:hypothetical protein
MKKLSISFWWKNGLCLCFSPKWNKSNNREEFGLGLASLRRKAGLRPAQGQIFSQLIDLDHSETLKSKTHQNSKYFSREKGLRSGTYWFLGGAFFKK